MAGDALTRRILDRRATQNRSADGLTAWLDHLEEALTIPEVAKAVASAVGGAWQSGQRKQGGRRRG